MRKQWFTLISLCILGLSPSQPARPQTPSSPVGGQLVGTIVGVPDTGPTGGFRTDARFMTVADFGFLPNGDMIVADSGQDRVFRIGPDGVVRLLAGNGLRAPYADNVPAVDTPFPVPAKLAADGAGNTFVAVAELSGWRRAARIRRIAPDGTAVTVAGNGEAGCPREGAVATQSPLGVITAMTASGDGALFFTSFECAHLYRLETSGLIQVAAGSPEGYPFGWPPPQGAAPASEIQMVSVRALSVDAANQPVLGFTDLIAKINLEGVAIRIAGPADANGSIRQGDANKIWMRGLNSMASLSDGSIAIAFSGTGSVGQAAAEIGIVEPDGNYRILASRDGFAGTTKLFLNDAPLIPAVVRADPRGNLYFLATPSGTIFRLPATGALEIYAGSPISSNAEYSLTAIPPVFRGIFQTNPVADAQGNLYFPAASKLYRMAPGGAITHIAGSGAISGSPDGTPPLEANLSFTGLLAIDGQANLYWRDVSYRFRRLSQQGALTTVLGGGSGFGFIEGQRGTDLGFIYNQPTLIGVSAAGESFYWWAKNSQNPNPSIWKVGTDGIATRIAGASSFAELPKDGAQAKSVYLADAGYFSVSPDGSVYFAPRQGGLPAIFRIDPQGILHLVTNGNDHRTVSNGEATATASSWVGSPFYAESANQLLLSASVLGHLARYTAGANVEVLRDADAGYARRDGGFLRDDRFLQATQFTPLPDGGFAWVESHSESRVLRRSFPVPAACAGQYAPGFTEFTAGGAGGRVTLPLTAGANCPWTVGVSSNWLEISGQRFGTGPVNLEIHYKPNPSPLPRTASLWIAGKEVLIRQQPSPAQDLLYITPTSAEISPAGGSVEVSVVASPGLPWAVALPSQVPVQVEGNSAGSGSATFRLRMEPLPTGVAERSAMVGVNARGILLRQRAAAQPVPFTVSSTSPGDKATIDLVERTLPYTAQWLPGSNHHVRFSPYRAIAERTVNQLIKLGDVPWASTRTVRTPAAGGGLQAEYRTLHFVELRSETAGTPRGVGTVFEYLGELVPNEFLPSGLHDSSNRAWFPAGSTVGVLATEGAGIQFNGFSGALQGMNNPASLHITEPVTVTANGKYAIVPQSPYLVASTPSFRFYGESRAANPWPIAVPQPAPDPVLFLARGIRVGERDWLTLRRPGATPPFTLEAQILPEGASAVISPAEPSREAQLYFHTPGYLPLVRTLSARLETVPSGGSPWIAAITDGGGFRPFPDGPDYSGIEQPGFAPGMIVSLFGGNFSTASASAQAVPLPTELAGARVEVRTAGSADWVAAPLFYVSPSQINFQIPPTATEGTLAVRAVRGQVPSENQWSPSVRARSASLFSADSSGNGAAAGSFVRVLPNQTQQRGDLFQCNNAGCTVNRVAFGGAQNELFLELYGTGFHNPGLPGSLKVYLGGREVSVEFAGPHPSFVGLDQLNIRVPGDIARNADLDLYLWVRNGDGPWMASNRLTVRFE